MTTRGRVVVRVLATVLIVAAVVLLATSLHTESVPEAGVVDGPRVETPLWSPRRAPFLVEDLAGAQRLRGALDDVLAPYDACASASGSVVGAAADHAAGRPLIPASTLKVLTGAAALQTLGADHRFVTTARSDTALDENGALAGDLFLVGGGDPVLSTPEYETYLRGEPRHRDDPVTPLAGLADALVANGLRRVDGAVLGDDTRHESLRYLPVWEPDYRDQGNIGFLSALTVDDANADFPGASPVDEPASHAAQELVRLLEERGVEVAGGSGHANGAAPAGADLAQIQSPPLSDIVAGLITSSDNQTAELLVREMGVAAGDGSTAAGLTVTTAALERLGIPLDGAHIVDGSGLSRQNLVSCTTLRAAVEIGDRPGFEALRDGLAIAGRTGTLAERMTDPLLIDRVRGKTGSLELVTGFTGVVAGEHPLTFGSIAQGEFTEAEGEALQERIAGAMATYPDVDDDLVPAP